ncbi:hypothetical protein MMC16_002432, partial [Acarospora aff. strigata]|nr:hypothetical protein [Acarospora aff. strigata]
MADRITWSTSRKQQSQQPSPAEKNQYGGQNKALNTEAGPSTEPTARTFYQDKGKSSMSGTFQNSLLKNQNDEAFLENDETEEE